jgi:3-phosphoshikimate 1-carboxyvinyltransferase
MEFGASGPASRQRRLPGDKSISHRALICAAMARGRSRIEGLSEGSDVAATAAALRAMGVRIERDGAAGRSTGSAPAACSSPKRRSTWAIAAPRRGCWHGPRRLHPIAADLHRRLLAVAAADGAGGGAAGRIGAEVALARGGRLPLTVRGLCPAVPRDHRMEVPSAQVKSALLLAALNIPGVTRIVEPVPTRDHSERMLARFGADIE